MMLDLLILEDEYKENERLMYDLRETLSEDPLDNDEFLSASTNLAWYEGRQSLISEILEI